MRKWLVWLLIPINLLILLLAPRFGWRISSGGVTPLNYRGVSIADGAIHASYGKGNDTVVVGYSNPLSKKLDITVNGAGQYSLEVAFDGQVIRETPELPMSVASDLIWKDAAGIFAWRYILVIALSFLSAFVFRKAAKKADQKKLLRICGAVIGLIPFLLAIRLF